MGKVIKRTYATRDDQLTQLKAGPISIVTGRNLRKRPDETPADVHPEDTEPLLEQQEKE